LEDSHFGILAANRAGISVAWIKDMVDLTSREGIKIDLTFETAYEVLDWLISHE
jgi:beta-phosphoglucomutase-like phosphatase (HAD superfamily)